MHIKNEIQKVDNMNSAPIQYVHDWPILEVLNVLPWQEKNMNFHKKLNWLFKNSSSYTESTPYATV